MSIDPADMPSPPVESLEGTRAGRVGPPCTCTCTSQGSKAFMRSIFTVCDMARLAISVWIKVVASQPAMNLDPGDAGDASDRADVSRVLAQE